MLKEERIAMVSKPKLLVGIVIAAVVVAIVVAAASIIPDKLRQRKKKELFANAQMAIAREDYAAAEAHFKELLTYLPDSAAVMLRICQACTEQGKFDEARSWVDKAEKIVPDKPEPSLQRAVICRNEAESMLSDAADGASANALAPIRKLCDRAEALLEQAGRLTGASPTIQSEVGRVQMVRADVERLITRHLVRQAEKERSAGHPDRAQSLTRQANEHRGKAAKLMDQAVKELAAASRLAPKEMALAELYARMCFKAEHWSEVVVAYRTATTRGKPTAQTGILAARAVLRQAALEGQAAHRQACRMAREILTQTTKQHPFDSKAKLELVSVELEAGNLDEAASLLEKVKTRGRHAAKVAALQARLSLAEGQYEQGRRELDELPTEARETADVKRLLARIERKTGHSARGIALLREALKLDEQDHDARLELARLLEGQGRRVDAQEVLDAGLRLDPAALALVRAATRLAVKHQDDNRVDRILSDAEDAATNREPLFRGLALFCLRLDRPIQAQRILKDTLKIDERMPLAKMGKSAAALAEGKPKEAIQTLEPMAAKRNQPTEVYLLAAQAYVDMGQLQNADAQLQQAFVASEGEYISSKRGAALYAEAGMLTEARSRNGRIISGNPDAPATLWQAIWIALLEGRLTRATDLAEQVSALATKPNSGEQNAVFHLLAGRYEQAIGACKEETGARCALIAFYAHAQSGHFDKAARTLEKAIRKNPDQIAFYYRLADHYVAAGKVEAGVSRLKLLTKLNPVNVDLAVGRAYRHAGLHAKALRAYESPLKLKTVPIEKRHEAWLRLGIAACHRDQGNTRAELAAYQEMQKDSAIGILGLEAAANLLLRVGQTRQVISLLDSATQTPSTARLSPDLLAKAADAYRRAGAIERAAAVLEQIAQQLPEAVWTHRAKADLYSNVGDLDKGLAEIDKALRIRPDSPALLIHRTLLRARAGDFEPALHALERMSKPNSPGFLRAKRRHALLLSQLGLHEAARKDLQALTSRKDAIDFDAKLALGRGFIQANRFDAANEALRGIPPTAGEFTTSRLLLANREFTQRQPAKAEALLTKALQRTPEAEGLAWACYRAKLEQGKVDEAMAFAREQVSRFGGSRLRWALAGGDGDTLRDALDQARGNSRLALGMAAWMLASGDYKALTSALPDTNATRPATKPDEAPRENIQAELLRVLATIASGKGKDAAARLDALRKRKDLSGSLTSIAAVMRLSVGKAPAADGLTKPLAEANDKALVAALAERAKTPAGKKACQWAAGSLIARTLRLPTLSYRLAQAATAADKESLGAQYVQLAALWDMGAMRSEPAGKMVAEMTRQSGDSLLTREALLRQHLAAQKVDEALALAKEWEAQGTVPADVAEVIASSALHANRKAEALRWCEYALKRSPGDLTLTNNLAYLLTELRADDPEQMARAKKLAETCYEKGGGQASFGETLGWILTMQGRVEEGLRLLQRAIVPLSDNPSTHYHIARAYQLAGKTTLARLHYQQVVATAEDKALVTEAKKALHAMPKPDRPTTTAQAA